MITIEQIKTIIVEVASHVDIDSIKNDVRLRDYDIDSLDFFNIVLELQTLSGMEVPDEDLDQLRTVDSIYKYFNDKN